MAAGALALALGLGAVAPAVAAEKSYSGAELVLEKYEAELKEVNKLREKALIADAKIKEAKDRLDAAKARLAKAKKEYEALYPSHVFVLMDGKKGDKLEDYYKPGQLEQRELDEAEKALAKLVPNKTFNGMDVVNRFKEGKSYAWVLEDNQNYVKGQATENPDTLEAAVRRLVNAAYDYYKNTKADSPRILAYQELIAAQGERDAAETNYQQVVKKYGEDRDTYEKKLLALQDIAKTYGYVVQIGNNGVKLVKEGDAKVKAPGKKDIKTLEEVKAQAEKTLEAAKLIIKNWPETVKDVRKDLDKLIEKQEKNIKLANERIAAAKKVSLVSTAYAEEDNRSDDQLIEDMLSTDKEINDKLDANEKKAKEENEKKPEEKKPEDKKDEEKKPEEKKPAKEAGKNVKTGVAGIAGVAGILAAASVAYAASKRD